MELSFTNKITVEQYNGLRKAVGWNELPPEMAEIGLRNSAFLTVLTDGGVPVGMARVITDYGYAVLIADVIVHPDYQGMGHGKAIMTRIMDAIRESITPGQTKFVNLMAAFGREGFYKQFGFTERPNATQGPGMSQWIPGLPVK